MSTLTEVTQLGQSPWLNYLRRAFIDSGELRDILDDGIRGITSTPSIFEKAITGSSDYDKAVRQMVRQGQPVKKIYQALVIDDIQRAADTLQPVFERTEHLDGYVSMELDPALARATVNTIAAARHLLALINRPNVMIEVPATPEGIAAIEALVNDGVNVNVTHIFSLDVYQKVAEAYIAGMEKYIASHSVWRLTPASVASFSVSRVDTAVDEVLAKRGRPDLQGKTGIAMAKLMYGRFREIFSGAHWEKLAKRGARAQRPKWTRTTPRNFSYPLTHYVDALIGPDTVVTLSPATLNAFRDHGPVANTLTQNVAAAKAHLYTLAELDIDLDAITQKLQEESLAAFDKYFHALIESVSRKRGQLEDEWRRMKPNLGRYRVAVDAALATLSEERVMCRIWEHDHTVWKPDPEEISNRLGWLHIIETMQENLGRLHSFAQSIHAGGYTHALLLGMGGSSLAPELFYKTFGKPTLPAAASDSHLELAVLDTTDPDAIRAQGQRLDPAKTLFIVATKSGGTVETLSNFKYFYNRTAATLGVEKAGAHFVAITDPGSKLVDIANRFQFRATFLNDPNIGGRYSALSYFGLVPAALVGVDVERLLDSALSMATNNSGCNRPLEGDNLAAQLGTIMGKLAQAGRDKVTLITSPALASFGDWVEQLIAESTGKDGGGILPVVGEPVGAPDVYGNDRLFIHLRLEGDNSQDEAVKALQAAGHPVVALHLKDLYDLGGQFFLWEMATAVAGRHLNIHPFNQPDVEAAKVLARRMVAAYKEKGEIPQSDAAPVTAASLHSFLEQARPGDYIALQAYVRPTAETDAALQTLRTQLRDRYKLATTVGYGPRFLHSTGQLHKGDRGNGLFIQFTSDAVEDVPIPDEAGKPGSTMTFGVLKMAQAAGDGQALRQAHRGPYTRLIRFHLGRDVVGGLGKLVGD